MSLKARIEAVIYAAEEPVTLVQLAALFGADLHEACAVRLSTEAAASREESPEPVADETTPELEMPALETPAPETPADGETAPLEVHVTPAAGESPEDASKRAAEEEKRAARLRDREARDEARRIVAELAADYAAGDRGMEIREIAGGYRMATKPEYHDAVREFIKSLKPPMKLSLQALETLAVIAYKQPVTVPEVSEIRGVDSGGVFGSLVSRKLISTAGRKQVIGRPILYKTTREFLLRFGLKDLKDLPSMEEFEKMAGELVEAEDAPLDATADQDATADDAASGNPAGELPLENAAESSTETTAAEPVLDAAVEERSTE